MFVLTGLLLTQLPRLFVWLSGTVVPAASLPRQSDVGPHVTLWQPAHGGHVGFPKGNMPGHVRTMPDLVGNWLRAHIR
jgi:predicted alpha/beta-fold hydrolase